MKTRNAGDILADAAKTYHARHKVYGDNYHFVGKVMAALFPDGIKAVTAHDWDRLHIFLLLIVKLTRYTNNYESGGHQDSIHDLAIYSAMLEAIDQEKE